MGCVIPGVQEPRGDPLWTAAVGFGIADVVEVDPELPLPADERDVLAVDDDDVVAAVVERVVDGLVPALEHAGDLLRRVERVLPLGVVNVPVAGERAPLLHALELGHPDPVRGPRVREWD